jgi:hypothetical protein
MELKTFIVETLNQIVEGVVEANKHVRQFGAAANPPNVFYPNNNQGPYGSFRGYEKLEFSPVVQAIEFNLAVTVSSGAETTGEGGIKIAGVKLGTTGKSDSGTESESRIRFTIPLLLPNASNPADTAGE